MPSVLYAREEILSTAGSMLRVSDIPEAWHRPILDQDFGYSFNAHLGDLPFYLFADAALASQAGAARATLRDALTRRSAQALRDFGDVLGYESATLLHTVEETLAATGERVVDEVVDLGDAVLTGVHAVESQASTLGTVLPWAVAALVAYKVFG